MKKSVYDFAPPVGQERFDTLFEHNNVTVERIVSSGSQPVVRYVQEHEEWVMLVSGEADMTVQGQPVSLRAGDTLRLPAHVPHEVLRTSAGAVWLAVHVREAK